MRVDVISPADEALEFPWESADPAGRYLDLRETPKAIEQVPAARRHPPLRTFLAAVNSGDSLFTTLRSKAWPEAAGTGSEAVYEFASRIDLVFASERLQSSLAAHGDLVERLRALLTKEDESAPLRAELSLVPCRFRAQGTQGCALRIVLRARGARPEQAELRWGLGLARIQQALLFTSRALRQQMGMAS
jgi:hypothetical protein